MSTHIKRWLSAFKDGTVRELATEIALQGGMCFEVERLLSLLDSKVAETTISSQPLNRR